MKGKHTMGFLDLFRKKTDTVNIDNINVETNVNDTYYKIKSMSVEEYNKYLKKQKHNDFLNARAKIEKIIDEAYQDYIDECKRNSNYILDSFHIEENTYGITENDIRTFLCNGKVKIKNYNVEWYYCTQWTIRSPELKVYVLKKGN